MNYFLIFIWFISLISLYFLHQKQRKEALKNLPIENLFKVKELKKNFGNTINIEISNNVLLIRDKYNEKYLLTFSLKTNAKSAKIALKTTKKELEKNDMKLSVKTSSLSNSKICLFLNNTFNEANVIILNGNLIISAFYLTDRSIYEEMKIIQYDVICNYTYKDKIEKYFNKNELDNFFNLSNNKNEF